MTTLLSTLGGCLPADFPEQISWKLETLHRIYFSLTTLHILASATARTLTSLLPSTLLPWEEEALPVSFLYSHIGSLLWRMIVSALPTHRLYQATILYCCSAYLLHLLFSAFYTCKREHISAWRTLYRFLRRSSPQMPLCTNTTNFLS